MKRRDDCSSRPNDFPWWGGSVTRLPPVVQCLNNPAVADVDEQVLRGRGIPVRVSECEREVEVGVNGPRAVLNEADVHDLQHVVVGDIPGHETRGSIAAARGTGT